LALDRHIGASPGIGNLLMRWRFSLLAANIMIMQAFDRSQAQALTRPAET